MKPDNVMPLLIYLLVLFLGGLLGVIKHCMDTFISILFAHWLNSKHYK